jgi:hypothetical protein
MLQGLRLGDWQRVRRRQQRGNYFLYASDPEGKTVGVFTIDGNTGALASIPGSPFAAGKAPMLLTIATP